MPKKSKYQDFTITIPTYNREEDLKKCLKSILNQELPPVEVIIIDDGNIPASTVEALKEDHSKYGIDLVYYQKDHSVERRGLSESKNIALGLIKTNIFFILDDDTVLLSDFCKKIMSVWNDNLDDDSLICVGGIIKNRRKKYRFENIYNKFFGLSSKLSWDVNRATYQVWNEDIKKAENGHYAHGGVSSYKLDLVKKIKFTTFSGGRTALEDVDFSLRAKNHGYYYIVNPEAQLYHYPSTTSREGKLLVGYKEGANRKVIFKSVYKKPSLFLWAWFIWASIGWTLRQFLIGEFRKGWGMIKGYLAKVEQ